MATFSQKLKPIAAEERVPKMLNSWISFGMKAWQLGFEAQGVISLRLMRLAAGGASAEGEASRMVTEKILAAGEAQMAGATAVMRGQKEHIAAGNALEVFSKRVRANKRRLMRRWQSAEHCSTAAG
jgi:hypothetical protein